MGHIVTTPVDADHPQVHVARSLAVATGGGAVAVVTAAEVSTLTTLSSLSLQKVRAPRQQTLLQVHMYCYFSDLSSFHGISIFS